VSVPEHRDDPFPPRPGPDELRRAVGRGRQLKLRRRLVRTGVAAGVVALATIGAASGFRDSGDRVRSAAASPTATDQPIATPGSGPEPTGPPDAPAPEATAGAESLSLVIEFPEEVEALSTTSFDLTVTNTSTAPLEAHFTHFDVKFTLADGHTETLRAIPLPGDWAELHLAPNERIEWRSDPQLVLGAPGDYTVQAFLTGPGGAQVPTAPETVRLVDPLAR
jgi:hypothetical protein